MPNNWLADRIDELIRAVDEIFVGKIPSEDDLYGIHQVLVERRNAELARQSVTDEAVQRAIEWAEQERKNSFRYMDFGDSDSASLAIVALRQMKPDLYLQAGNDPEADDWANGYSGGYADGLQAHKKPIDDAVKDAMEWAEKELDYYVNFEHCADSAKDKVALYTILTALRQMRTEPCWYCKGIESHGIKSVKTVTDESDRELGAYDTPYNFCPNCGKELVKHDG